MEGAIKIKGTEENKKKRAKVQADEQSMTNKKEQLKPIKESPRDL